MMNTKQHILLAVFAVVFLLIPWVILGYIVDFKGADGNSVSTFPPLRLSEKWFDLVWETPRGQLANILLVIQAVVCAIIIVYFILHTRKQRNRNKDTLKSLR